MSFRTFRVGDQEFLLRENDSEIQFSEGFQTLLEKYHTDLITLFLSALLSVMIFVLLIEWIGDYGIVQQSMMSLISSIISAVMITTVYYIRRIPVII